MSESKGKKDCEEGNKHSSSSRPRRSSASRTEKKDKGSDKHDREAASMSTPLKEATQSSSETSMRAPVRPKAEIPRDDPR